MNRFEGPPRRYFDGECYDCRGGLMEQAGEGKANNL